MTDFPDPGPEALPDDLGPSLRGGAADAGGQFVYVLNGELDLSGADLLVARLAELIDGSTGRVVLDLANVEFVDSTGLRALLRVRDLAEVYDSRVVLRSITAPVQRLLELTQVEEVFHYEP